MLERITEQAFLNGFRNVILMGDHAGGQPDVYQEVANKLNARYGALRVFYCEQVYRPANDAFDQYLAQQGYPPGLHGYIFDTSEMMYLDKDNTWVRRDLVASAVGDPVVDGKVLAKSAFRGTPTSEVSVFIEGRIRHAGQAFLLRLEGFNLFNHGNMLGRAQTTYGDTLAVNPTFGQLVSVGTATNALPSLANIDPPRMLQIQLRYLF